jgi:hypothetical protein
MTYIAFIYHSQTQETKVLNLQMAKEFVKSQEFYLGNYELVNTIDICLFLSNLINNVPLSKVHEEIESLIKTP